MVRVSALRPGGREFDPRPGHTKDSEKRSPMPLCLALSIKGRIEGLDQWFTTGGPGITSGPRRGPQLNDGDLVTK